MPVRNATVDRLLAYQAECAAAGTRPPYAIFGLVAAIARHEHEGPVGLRRACALTGLTRQGALDLLAVGVHIGVIERVPVGKRHRYITTGTVNSVDQTPEGNGQLSRPSDNQRSTQLTVERSTELHSELTISGNGQLSRPLADSTVNSVDQTQPTRARDKGTSLSELIEPTPLPPVEEGAAEPPPVVPLTANEAYHELTNRNLPNEVRPKWNEAVARHGIERMREVVVCWRAAGFSPTNHKGQLDWMRKGVPAKHRLDSDLVYEAKEIAADLGAKGHGNGFTTKTDRNRSRLREVAEDIAGLRSGGAQPSREDPRDRDQGLLGDGSRGPGPRGASADRRGVGGDCSGDPDLEAARFIH